MTIELTPDICAEYFAKHLYEPVGGDHCPLTYVLMTHGVGRPNVELECWTDYADNSEPQHTMPDWAQEFVLLVDKRRWYEITGTDALAMPDEAVGL